MEAEDFAARRLDDLSVRDNPMLQKAIYVANPGDLILGEEDWVVVVARRDLAEVLSKCNLRREKEEKIKEDLKSSTSTLELFEFDKMLRNRGMG